MKKINVMVIDDSALVRQVLGEIIKSDKELNLLCTASDPIFAQDKMKKEWPDVIILDVEMPRMDGITFLKKIMSERPTPIIICSTLTQKNADTTMMAMSAGAVEIIAKPHLGLKNFLSESSQMLIDSIKAASLSNRKRLGFQRSNTLDIAKRPSSANNISKPVPKRDLQNVSYHQTVTAPSTLGFSTTEKVVAIGTSTGGTIALEYILTELSSNAPGIVIVQHMPEKFTEAFANRLNTLSQLNVREAKSMDRVIPGVALIAPGNKHMVLRRSGTQFHVEVQDGPLISRHRPSVDVLFKSVAKVAGKNAVGIIMTGMGSDGAYGLKEMYDAGAITYAQDEESCVVFGMPKEAIKLGAAKEIISLNDVPKIIEKYRT
ncbi:MAG: chemotaxis response regulator protein-glutamate methylesterase [Leptospiraceae bacterium]|nr:chemotaxis response regulator protein-glutamate methylesterase [Leptospiraceae bacterium]MCP5497577.1 chemotaxis response regulator protein-glutamate methylesterase [Leptospiraceae bacterium]